ncbi:MAG: hypothetical protein ACE5OW_07510 [Candidatus Bathyarchaeia archaeon]
MIDALSESLWLYVVIAFALGAILIGLVAYFVKSGRERPASLVTCPGCGAEVSTPRKSWPMIGRPSKDGRRLELTIGLFDCPRCGKTFRKVTDKRRI